MEFCRHCKSNRILYVSAKCSDLCFIRYQDKEQSGYVPEGLGIDGLDGDEGFGDYVKFNLCLDCGRHQGHFPIDDAAITMAFVRAAAEK